MIKWPDYCTDSCEAALRLPYPPRSGLSGVFIHSTKRNPEKETTACAGSGAAAAARTTHMTSKCVCVCAILPSCRRDAKFVLFAY